MEVGTDNMISSQRAVKKVATHGAARVWTDKQSTCLGDCGTTNPHDDDDDTGNMSAGIWRKLRNFPHTHPHMRHGSVLSWVGVGFSWVCVAIGIDDRKCRGAMR